MTLLEYAHGWYDIYQSTKPYMEFKTFVESLKRPSNKTLIESISTGVGIIIEANLGINLGKIKNDSSEFYELIKSGDKRAILGYALPIIYRLVQVQGGEDAGKTESLLTKAIDYVTDKWKNLLDYDGSTKPSTFLNTYVMRPAKSARREEAGQRAEIINYPHEECKAAFEDDYNGMNTKIYGTVKDPNVSGGKVTIAWQKGPNEGMLTNEYKDDMVFYDIVEDSNKTVSASTPLDVNKGAGGQEETLADTAAFADTREEKETNANNAKNIIDEAIKQTAHYLAQKNAPEDDDEYERLNGLYTKYLTNMIDKQDANEDAPATQADKPVIGGNGESVTELANARKDLLWSKTRKWQSLAKSLNILANKLEQNGTLQQIDPSISAESIGNGLKSLTPAAKEGAKKRGGESIAKTANSTNLKEVLGDALYELVYKQKAGNIDELDNIDAELSNLSNVRTKTDRRASASTDVNISDKDKKTLEELLKGIAQRMSKTKIKA